MKNKLSTIAVLAIAASPAFAEDDKKVTGTLSLDAYSHFISYGNDVWSDGGDSNDYAFNPLLELSFDIGNGWSASLGTWWDVNDKAPGGSDSALGGKIQEIDVWAGIGYESGIYSASLTYQQWYYGSNTEEILDLGLALDVFLSPSLTIHHRLDAGAAAGAPLNGDEGTIAVFGLEYGFETGPVSWSVPVNVAYFLTDDFHGDGADDGFGYASIGLNASTALPFLDNTLGGEWAFNAGLTLYTTDNDVTVNNVDNNFFVTNFGISTSF